MANYFQFKEFTVQQDNAAMKVTTDSCLFGGWSAQQLQEMTAVSSCLDIGSGTGLLALMLAQKYAAKIDAVEIDESASQQARDNFLKSSWSDRLRVFNTDVSSFTGRYDFIICNPPFYEHDLRSPSKKVNLARHDKGLTLDQLAFDTERLLSMNGYFSVLVPYFRIDELVKIISRYQLHLLRKTVVKQTPSHDFFRGMLLFGREKEELITEEMVIQVNGEYSTEFKEVLKDYYLAL